MKKMFAAMTTAAVLAWALSGTSALAKDKEVTIKGEAKCAMCMLHEGSSCKTVIQTSKSGKTTTYYLVDNDISKAFTEDVISDFHRHPLGKVVWIEPFDMTVP